MPPHRRFVQHAKKALRDLFGNAPGLAKLRLPPEALLRSTDQSTGLSLEEYMKLLHSSAQGSRTRPLAADLSLWAHRNLKEFDAGNAGRAMDFFIRFDRSWQVGLKFAIGYTDILLTTPHHAMRMWCWSDVGRTLLAAVTLLSSHGRQRKADLLYLHLTHTLLSRIPQLNVLGVTSYLAASDVLGHRFMTNDLQEALVSRLLSIAHQRGSTALEWFRPRWVSGLCRSLDARYIDSAVPLLGFLFRRHCLGMTVAQLAGLVRRMCSLSLVYGVFSETLNPVLNAVQRNVEFLPDAVDISLAERVLADLQTLQVPAAHPVYPALLSAVPLCDPPHISIVMRMCPDSAGLREAVLRRVLFPGEGGVAPTPAMILECFRSFGGSPPAVQLMLIEGAVLGLGRVTNKVYLADVYCSLLHIASESRVETSEVRVQLALLGKRLGVAGDMGPLPAQRAMRLLRLIVERSREGGGEGGGTETHLSPVPLAQESFAGVTSA